jgi:hypothetical protein
MEKTKDEDNTLRVKYECLLKGILPDSYKQEILKDKLNLLQRENLVLETTVSQLRHEISNLIAKQKFEASNTVYEKLGYKYHALSAALAKCLEASGCELSSFTNSYEEAVQALNAWGEGFTQTISLMRTKLASSNKQVLDFMHTILEEMHNLRANMTIIQNYIAVLEFNETYLRDSLKKIENKNFVTRSLSLRKIEQMETGENKNFHLDFNQHSQLYMEHKDYDLQTKVNKLTLSLGKVKNQKDRAKIESEKILLQLKQTKEQLAIAEENAGARELAYENRIKKLSSIINKLKELPNIEEIITKYEKELDQGSKKHSRTRSSIILYSRS